VSQLLHFSVDNAAIKERFADVLPPNLTYQFHHPWHWLTYGQNATALGVVVACFGLIGLVFYTFYTRRMMKLGEDTRRATITPVLISRGGVQFDATAFDPPTVVVGLPSPTITEYRATLNVRNIGEGAALFLQAWCQPVSQAFDVNDTSILSRTPHAAIGEHELTELFKGEFTGVAFPGFKPTDLHRRWVFIVDCIDQSNGKHQLKILRTGLPSGETHVSMAHSGDTLGERVEKCVSRFVEILNAVIRAFRKLGK
jgi:hypothetical protein